MVKGNKNIYIQMYIYFFNQRLLIWLYYLKKKTKTFYYFNLCDFNMY